MLCKVQESEPCHLSRCRDSKRTGTNRVSPWVRRSLKGRCSLQHLWSPEKHHTETWRWMLSSVAWPPQATLLTFGPGTPSSPFGPGGPGKPCRKSHRSRQINHRIGTCLTVNLPGLQVDRDLPSPPAVPVDPELNYSYQCRMMLLSMC